MKINSATQIVGLNVCLVPYREIHVERYHDWMKSSELQYLTGSEPLTIDEEYAMQKSWRDDANKCTFIILDRNQLVELRSEVDSMIGDTNLYFNNSNEAHTAECEIMIAEERARGRRMGWEALILMLRYGIDELKVDKYCAKIKMDNEISIKMFEKLQFQELSRSAVFEEITFEKSVNKQWTQWLISETSESIRNKDQYIKKK